MMSVKREPLLTLGWRPSSRRWLFLATMVLLIAAAFRLVALDEIPPGLAQDEVLDADIASFIRGGEHALFFRHGYGHEPLYHYWVAPFQAMFGDNVLSIRLPAAWLGLLLVALTLRWARRDYGATVALIAGFGLAVSWWPIIFSRIGIRPILEPVLLVAAVWFWPLRDTEFTRRGLRSAALAGLFFGLSIYTYTAARIILLIPFLVLVVLVAQFLWIKRESAARSVLRTQIVYTAAVLLVGLLIYLPLAVTLRANPDLQQRLEQLEGPLSALEEGDAGPILNMTAATLGVFSITGDPRWTYSLPNRPLFDLVTAALFYGGLALAMWRWRRPYYLLLPVWLAVALLPSALSPDAPSTVRLIGALPVVYLLPGLAVDAAGGRLRGSSALAGLGRRRSLLLFLAVLALLLGVNTFRTVRDGFIRWPQDLETRLRYQSTLRDIGRHWLDEGSGHPPVVAEVFFEPIDAAGLRRAIGSDPDARWIQTGAGVAGALVWPGGIGGANLYVPEYAPLDPGLMALAGLDNRPIYRSGNSPSFAVYALPPPPSDLMTVGEDFGREIIASLEGATFPAASESDLSFATWWRVHAGLPEDIAIFIHLVDSQGEIVAQYDGLDAAASTLRPGDAFLQRHVIHLPEEMNPGVFSLRLGLYRRLDGQRIPPASGGDAIEFAQCEVGLNDAPGLECSLTGLD